jgi:hypothetical protein
LYIGNKRIGLVKKGLGGRVLQLVSTTVKKGDEMSVSFESISLAKQDSYQRRLEQVPQLSSDYSFANLWAWCDEYDLSWGWDDDLIWIRQGQPQPVYWAPIGDWNRISWDNRLAALAEKLDFIRVPELLASQLLEAGCVQSCTEQRDHWDYLYSVEELIGLKGNRFHSKKNLLRQFQKKNHWSYVPLDGGLIKEALLMQYDWCAWRNCEASAGLSAENRVITKVLDFFDTLNLLGGAIVVGNLVVAFTVAEALGPKTLLIHFEKGFGGYRGVYQAINREFLAAHAGFEIVNREQDLGNEGLRKAKLSYNPVGFLKKFRLALR